MAERFNVFWSSEAKVQVDQVVSFIRENWGENEVNEFLDILLHFERTVAIFPKSFKESVKFKGCRLGYVHRHITAIYKITRRSVTILTIIDNRSAVKK
jgi:plasmid stabilization system protein ParE